MVIPEEDSMPETPEKPRLVFEEEYLSGPDIQFADDVELVVRGKCTGLTAPTETGEHRVVYTIEVDKIVHKKKMDHPALKGWGT